MSSISLFPPLLVGLGAWLIWWGVRRSTHRSDLPQDWRRVTGTVLDVGDRVTTAPRIEYRTPDGRRLRVPGPLEHPFEVGDEVTVLVDPTDPRRARLDLTEREAVLVVRLLVATGAVLLLVGAVTGIALL